MLQVSQGAKKATHSSLWPLLHIQHMEVLQTFNIYIRHQRDKKNEVAYFREAIGCNPVDPSQLKLVQEVC